MLFSPRQSVSWSKPAPIMSSDWIYPLQNIQIGNTFEIFLGNLFWGFNMVWKIICTRLNANLRRDSRFKKLWISRNLHFFSTSFSISTKLFCHLCFYCWTESFENKRKRILVRRLLIRSFILSISLFSQREITFYWKSHLIWKIFFDYDIESDGREKEKEFTFH